MFKKAVWCVASLALVAGCSTEASGVGNASAPEIEDSDVTEQQLETNWTNGWTMNAGSTTTTNSGWYKAMVTGSATFTGTPNVSAKVGVCLLTEVRANDTTIGCSAANKTFYADGTSEPSDCISAGVERPLNGWRYCANNRCYVRPGDVATWCAGSPVTQAAVQMPASGTLTLTQSVRAFSAGDQTNSAGYAGFISYACFAQCSGTGGQNPNPSIGWQLEQYSYVP